MNARTVRAFRTKLVVRRVVSQTNLSVRWDWIGHEQALEATLLDRTSWEVLQTQGLLGKLARLFVDFFDDSLQEGLHRGVLPDNSGPHMVREEPGVPSGVGYRFGLCHLQDDEEVVDYRLQADHAHYMVREPEGHDGLDEPGHARDVDLSALEDGRSLIRWKPLEDVSWNYLLQGLLRYVRTFGPRENPVEVDNGLGVREEIDVEILQLSVGQEFIHGFGHVCALSEVVGKLEVFVSRDMVLTELLVRDSLEG